MKYKKTLAVFAIAVPLAFAETQWRQIDWQNCLPFTNISDQDR